MVYKIGNISDVRDFPYLPQCMQRTISGLASLLTNAYGADRDVDNSDGGFILYAEPGTTAEDLKSCFDYTSHTVEFINVESEVPICMIQYVLNNEFAVTIVMWTHDLPDEIKREMDDENNAR